MKRDLDLVKAILLYFEQKDDWEYEKDLIIEGYDNELVSYHLAIMYDAGLINAETGTSKTGRVINVLPFRLTWEGHEFLDNIKDEPRWERIKQTIKTKGGNFSIGLIRTLAYKLAEEQLLG